MGLGEADRERDSLDIVVVDLVGIKEWDFRYSKVLKKSPRAAAIEVFVSYFNDS